MSLPGSRLSLPAGLLLPGLLLPAGLVFVAWAVYFSRVLVFSDDESGYPSLGHLAVLGQITLCQSEIARGASLRCPSTCSAPWKRSRGR